MWIRCLSSSERGRTEERHFLAGRLLDSFKGTAYRSRGDILVRVECRDAVLLGHVECLGALR